MVQIGNHIIMMSAYCKNKNNKEDFAIGVSFGQRRDLSFMHVNTGQIFNIQKNGDCFAFNSIVNSKFKHGVLKGSKSKMDERFSIIAWGKRRTLNDRNSGINERNKNKVFTGRQIYM